MPGRDVYSWRGEKGGKGMFGDVCLLRGIRNKRSRALGVARAASVDSSRQVGNGKP